MINAVDVVQVADSVQFASCRLCEKRRPAKGTRDILPSCFTVGRIVEQWDIIVNAC